MEMLAQHFIFVFVIRFTLQIEGQIKQNCILEYITAARSGSIKHIFANTSRSTKSSMHTENPHIVHSINKCKNSKSSMLPIMPCMPLTAKINLMHDGLSLMTS